MQFFIDAKSGVPSYRQIIDQVKVAVACGHFRPGDRLPTVYQLAADLSISVNTVIRAYRTLEIEGMLATKHGSGTFVSDHELNINRLERQRMLDQIPTEAKPHIIDDLVLVRLKGILAQAEYQLARTEDNPASLPRIGLSASGRKDFPGTSSSQIADSSVESP